MNVHSVLLGSFTLLLASPFASAQEGPNLLLNGDFENTTSSGCQANLTNAAFNALVPHVTAFGDADQVDRLDGSCWGTPLSGAYRIGLSMMMPAWRYDKVALELAAPVVAGATYRIKFWTYKLGIYSAPDLYVGLSNSPTNSGTQIGFASAPPNQVWTLYETLIVAPLNAGYLTITAGNAPSSSNLIEVDAVEVHYLCGSSTAYCTAKTNSLGCVPAISSTGCASATQGSNLIVQAAPVLNQKPGVMLYSVTGRAATPFQGGFLCVASPVRRTVPANSGGSALPASDCTGVYSLDLGAFASGALGGNPAPELSVQGTTVDCQWWGRDPGFPAPSSSTLSDGLEYVVWI